MCGRCCLTLSPSEIQQVCRYNSCENKEIFPEWRSEYNFGRQYEPSFNIAPTDITPVLVSADYFEDLGKFETQSNDCCQCLVPMLWGMIPPWHKGNYKKHGLSTNNCRLENLLESKLYSTPFRKGQRCIILCEGFYEWQTTKLSKVSQKSAYYIFSPQKVNVKIYDKKTWSKDKININLLKLAGLFETWKDENGDIIYSYSIITFESDKVLSWLHHRTPAILETDEQVANWLDFKRVSHLKAFEILKPPKNLSWYKVSNSVNNSRNKHYNCNKPLHESKSNLLQNWLTSPKLKEVTSMKRILSPTIDSDNEVGVKDCPMEKKKKNDAFIEKEQSY